MKDQMITITREDFGQALPIGASVHDEVYESVAPAIAVALDSYSRSLLGEAGQQLLASPDCPAGLERSFKSLVALDAFLGVLRQLDLVLTPTGFGIVSTDTLSPASQQRVDALERQLRTALCRATAQAVDQLRSPSWGRSAEACCYIRYVYTEHYYFFSPHSSPSLTYLDWQAMQPAIQDADEQVRLRFGDAQTDDMLDALRCADRNRLKAYAGAMQLMCDLADQWRVRGLEAASSATLRRLSALMEADGVTFALYHGSAAYAAAHTPPFTNRKHSAAFFFNG